MKFAFVDEFVINDKSTRLFLLLTVTAGFRPIVGIWWQMLHSGFPAAAPTRFFLSYLLSSYSCNEPIIYVNAMERGWSPVGVLVKLECSDQAIYESLSLPCSSSLIPQSLASYSVDHGAYRHCQPQPLVNYPYNLRSKTHNRCHRSHGSGC
jgi:hypothetical protein